MSIEKIDGKWWLVDNRPSRRYPIYCRGNVGEVLPNVASPLTGSLGISRAARGQERWATENGMVSAEQVSDSDSALTPIIGGYMYANVSLSRLMAVRAPVRATEGRPRRAREPHDGAPSRPGNPPPHDRRQRGGAEGDRPVADDA